MNDEFKPCFLCGDDCETKELSLDLIRCPACVKEYALMDEDRFEHIREREARERIA